MHLLNLGSGSRGNATIVAHEGRAVLIDAGLSRRRIRQGLEGLALEAVLITHCHTDHLGAAAGRLGVPIWIERRNWLAGRTRIAGGATVEFFDGRPFDIGPFRITPFPVPHPGDEPWTNYGFRIECGRRRIAYATDLGSVPSEVLEAISDVHALFLESNHDPSLERGSDRDDATIDWVLSPHGHLSNDECAEALAKLRPAPAAVVLGHLSEDCNRPQLAVRAARKALPGATDLRVAEQACAMAPVAV